MKFLFGLVVALAVVAGVAPRVEAQQRTDGPLLMLINDPAYAQNFGGLDRTTATALNAAVNEIRTLCPNGCPPGSGLQDLDTRLTNLNSYAATVLSNQLPPTAVLPAIQDIRRALRALAPEEFSALRIASNEFGSDQRDQIRSRLEAVRKGAQGFAVNRYSRDHRVADGRERTPTRTSIGAASAEALPADFSRWGGFLNGAYTDAKRDASDLEDAFDLTGNEASLGVDYRLGIHGVIGAMVSYANRDLKFDASSSDASGRIESDGFAAVLYASYEWDGPYLSASAGVQRLKNDIRRDVRYEIPPDTIDAVATGSTDSNAFTATLDGGWMFQNGAFSYEPLIRVLYRNTQFDAFTETAVDRATSLPVGIDYQFGERSTATLNASLGMKAAYVLTPAFGVLTPYAQAEYRREFKDEAMKSTGDFADLVAAGVTSPTATLTLNSDRPDTSYYAVELGVSAVFKHGIQAFLNGRSLFGLSNSDLLVMSVGLRGEF